MAKILVIDDSAFMRKTIRGFLEEAGFLVEDFLPKSIQELFVRVQTSKPDLVISDFNMPEIDGLTVARTVKRADDEIQVVILTATRDAAKESVLGTIGVRRILHKPIDGESLVTAIKEVLQNS